MRCHSTASTHSGPSSLAACRAPRRWRRRAVPPQGAGRSTRPEDVAEGETGRGSSVSGLENNLWDPLTSSAHSMLTWTFGTGMSRGGLIVGLRDPTAPRAGAGRGRRAAAITIGMRPTTPTAILDGTSQPKSEGHGFPRNALPRKIPGIYKCRSGSSIRPIRRDSQRERSARRVGFVSCRVCI